MFVYPRFVAIKIFDNPFHIVYRNFCLVLILVWFENLIKIWSILSSRAYARALEPSAEINRSKDSTIDPKYSLNVLAISFFLKSISLFDLI